MLSTFFYLKQVFNPIKTNSPKPKLVKKKHFQEITALKEDSFSWTWAIQKLRHAAKGGNPKQVFVKSFQLAHRVYQEQNSSVGARSGRT